MALLTIRKLDQDVREKLRVRAARHGHSMEEEAGCIIKAAVSDREAPPENAFDALRRHFVGLGDVQLDLPARRPGREPPSFD